MKKSSKYQLQWVLPDSEQRKQWDALVMHAPQGNIYSLSWYLDVVCGSKGWGLVTSADMTTGLPLAFKHRLGYKNIYQPFYTMYFEVINPLSEVDAYLETVQQKFHHIHITTQTPVKKIKSKTRIRQEINLANKQAIVYAENAKRQLKKAVNNNLTHTTNIQPEQVVNLFKQNKGATLKEYKTTDFKRLLALIKASVQAKMGYCTGVQSGNELLAAGFFLQFKDRVIFLKGAVSEKGKSQGAMYFLMDKEIQKARELKRTCFDFGGSNAASVATFYHKLGGQDVAYNEIVLDQSNLLQRILKKVV